MTPPGPPEAGRCNAAAGRRGCLGRRIARVRRLPGSVVWRGLFVEWLRREGMKEVLSYVWFRLNFRIGADVQFWSMYVTIRKCVK